MTLHLYLDAALTNPISEGDHSNPDKDLFNGSDGEAKDRLLYLANEQTTLSSGLDEVTTVLPLASPVFANGDILAIGTEQLRIISDGGTTTPTVERGYGGTTPITHSSGDAVYAGYDYADLTITPLDMDGADETSWITLGIDLADLDTNTPGTPLNLSAKTHQTTHSFWRRITVPANTPVQNKTDLRLQISATQNPIL